MISSTWMAVGGAVLAWVGGVSYWLLMGHPWVRSTAIPSFVLMAAGCALGIWGAVRSGRGWPVWLAAGNVLLTGFFTFAFVVLFRLPPAPVPAAVGRPAPDFEVANQDGEPVRLSSFQGRGPVLLVFYRGFW